MAVLGLAGLGLVQTGVLFPPAPSLSLPQESGPAPAQAPPEQAAPPETVQPAPSGKSGQLPPAETQKQPEATPAEPGSGSPVAVPKVGTGERRYPKEQAALPAPERQERKSAVEPSRNGAPAPRAGKAAPKASKDRHARGGPVVIRLQVDPERQRGEINIARVHFGDRIVVKVRRERGAERQVYLTFGLPDLYERAGRHGRMAIPRAVLTPVSDRDQVILNSEREFGPDLTRRLNSKGGAVLKLGTRSTRVSYSSPPRPDRGRYDIEIRIHSENRRNIMARSYL